MEACDVVTANRNLGGNWAAHSIDLAAAYTTQAVLAPICADVAVKQT